MDEEVTKQVTDVVETPQATEQLRGRSALMDMLKKNNPDSEYDDDGAIDALLEMYNSQKGNYDRINGISNQLAEGIKADPRSSEIIQAIIGKQNLFPVIAKRYGSAVRELDPESDEFKEIVKAEEERLKAEQEAFDRTAKEEAEFNSNLEKSDSVFKQFVEQEGMNEDEFSDMLKWAYENIYAPAFTGLYTVEGLNALKKAYAYDTDVDSAQEAGRAAGRTEKIRETSKAGLGDGVPNLAASSGKTSDKNDLTGSPSLPIRPKRGGWGTNTTPIK